ncbi:hypothetical protein T03_2560 [Trichinella britovi]|uniref:Uncharacterized protein n=1 Tax=Trichinella britovi TaxID=45882 RepID=A0A0V1CKN3_TRIBR|nr:hypothetical protein T03_2560 [Trichinella britovi]
MVFECRMNLSSARVTADPVSTSMSHPTLHTEPSTIRVSISGDSMTTTGKVRLVVLTSLARASREEAWHFRLMWPSTPHFQHRLSPLLSGQRRCRGGGLFVAAGVVSVSSSFSCRNTSAKSSPTSLRVVTAAAAASVTLLAVGSRSAHLRERLREDPAQVTSEHPHAFAPLLFPPENLGGKPFWPGAHPECFKQGRLQAIVIVRLLDVHGPHYAPHLRISVILDKGCSSLWSYTAGTEVQLHVFEPDLNVRYHG